MKKYFVLFLLFLVPWFSSAQYFHGDVPDSYEMWAEDDPFSFEYLRGLASYVSNGVLTAKNLAESPEEWFVFQPIDDKTTSVTGPSSLFPTNETDVILPSLVGGRKVVNIGNSSFGYYYYEDERAKTKIRSIYSATVTTIGTSAFARNQSLLRATLPACLNVGNSSFYMCSNIVEVSINSATNIGDKAFEICGVTSLLLPAVKTMGSQSLNKSSVTNLYVPSLRPGNTNWWTTGYGPVGVESGSTNRLEVVTLGPQAAWFSTTANFRNGWKTNTIFRFPRGCDWYKTMSFFTGRTCVEYDPDPWEIQYVGTYGIQNQIKAAASTQDVSRAVAPLVSTQALIEATSSLAKTQDVSEAVSMLVSTQTQISASIANLPAQSRFLIYDTATNVVWRRVISNGWEYLVAQTNYVGGAQ